MKRMKADRTAHEVEKILGSLEGIQRADPGPCFYARMKARAVSDAPIVLSWSWKMVIAGLLVLNALSYYYVASSKTEAIAQDPIEQLLQDYFEGSAGIYDLAYND